MMQARLFKEEGERIAAKSFSCDFGGEYARNERST